MNVGNMAKKSALAQAEAIEREYRYQRMVEDMRDLGHQQWPNALEDLQQQLAAAREALQAAEADAARYRWLRGEGFERPASMWVIDYATKIPVVHTDLDAAIDATLQRDRQP